MKRIIHAIPGGRTLAVVLLAVVLLTMLGIHPALADVAPPLQPPGSNPQAGEGTQVRMVSEEVIFTLNSLPRKDEPSQAKDEVSADVVATFNMRNLGTADETMRVRFPLMDLSGIGDGMGSFPELRKFRVSVDGVSTNWDKVPQQNPQDSNSDPLTWAEFNVAFPTGKDVQIVVHYTVDPTGYYPQARFSYIFHTGAGWKDTIGSADLIVRLPYDATAENVTITDETDNYWTTHGAVLQGKEIRYHWENFEPTEQDDWRCTLVVPNTWRSLLDARDVSKSHPNTANNWLKRAKYAYLAAFDGKRSIRSGQGAVDLILESRSAYEKAIALKEDQVAPRVDFAQMLLTALVDDRMTEKKALEAQIQEQIDAIEKLDPSNENLGYLREQLKWYIENYPEGATPAATDSVPTTVVAQAEVTTLPAPTNTPAPIVPLPTLAAEQSRPGLGCLRAPAAGGILFFGLMAILSRRGPAANRHRKDQ